MLPEDEWPGGRDRAKGLDVGAFLDSRPSCEVKLCEVEECHWYLWT